MTETVWKALPQAALRNRLLDLTAGKGTLQIYNPMEGVLVSRADGHMELALAEQWARVTEPLWARGARLTVFNDWERMSTYDSGARKLLTDWVLSHRAQMDCAWFCTSSRIVAMGVAAAGALTALAGVSMHASTDRAQFERELRKRLGQ
jgi:hypothetical protein